MKLQLSKLTVGIIACTLPSIASASPMPKPVGSVIIIRRGLSEWGIGHYGGTVSEISKQAAVADEIKLQDVIVLGSVGPGVNIDSLPNPTITTAPAVKTAAPELVTTEEPTTWSTTTLTVTATVTAAAAAETIATKAKREEVVISDDGVATGVDDVDGLITELNQFFKMDVIGLGDPCTPVTDIDYKICIGDAIAVCGSESWAWEADTNCSSSGLVCGAIKVPDTVNGGSKGDIKCLEE